MSSRYRDRSRDRYRDNERRRSRSHSRDRRHDSDVVATTRVRKRMLMREEPCSTLWTNVDTPSLPIDLNSYAQKHERPLVVTTESKHRSKNNEQKPGKETRATAEPAEDEWVEKKVDVPVIETTTKEHVQEGRR